MSLKIRSIPLNEYSKDNLEDDILAILKEKPSASDGDIDKALFLIIKGVKAKEHGVINKEGRDFLGNEEVHITHTGWEKDQIYSITAKRKIMHACGAPKKELYSKTKDVWYEAQDYLSKFMLDLEREDKITSEPNGIPASNEPCGVAVYNRWWIEEA